MSIKQLDHLNLTVKNLDETLAWYGKVFGMEVVESGERGDVRWAILRGGDAMLCVYEHPDKSVPARFNVQQAQHAIYHFGFRITDREAWLARVEAHDLELEFGGEVDYASSTSWYVSDPTGYGIEVVLWDADEVSFREVA
jgi:catechol-2,3-dioxygenase